MGYECTRVYVSWESFSYLIPAPPGPPAVTICRANMTTGFLIAHSSGGIPTSYSVTINSGGRTIKDTVLALSNGTATYSFAYTG